MVLLFFILPKHNIKSFNHHASGSKLTFRRAASKYDFKLKKGFTSCVQKLPKKSRDSASQNSANLDGALSAGVHSHHFEQASEK